MQPTTEPSRQQPTSQRKSVLKPGARRYSVINSARLVGTLGDGLDEWRQECTQSREKSEEGLIKLWQGPTAELDFLYSEDKQATRRLSTLPNSCYGLALRNIFKAWYIGAVPKYDEATENSLAAKRLEERIQQEAQMRKLVECGLFDASDQQATSTTINGTDTTKILPEALVTSIASTLEGGLESLDEYENDYDPEETEKDRSMSWLHTLVKCVLPLARLVGGGIFSSIVLIGAGLYVVALVSLLLIPVAATGYFLAYMLLGLPIMFLFLDRMHALHKMKFPAHWGFVRTISYLIMAGKYLVDTHFPAFVSFFAQGGITWVLWYSLPSFEGSEFCPQSESNYFYLEIALLGLFYAALIASFNEIFLEMRLICAKRIAITRGETTLLIRIPFSYTIYARLLLVVMMELTVWVGVAIVGTKYILTAGQPSDLIQAAVAINFINDIDNCFYDSYVPGRN